MIEKRSESGEFGSLADVRTFVPEGSDIAPCLLVAAETFNRELPSLLASNAGQWVAYHGTERIGIGRSKTELSRLYSDVCPRRDLYIRKVVEHQPIHLDW